MSNGRKFVKINTCHNPALRYGNCVGEVLEVRNHAIRGYYHPLSLPIALAVDDCVEVRDLKLATIKGSQTVIHCRTQFEFDVVTKILNYDWFLASSWNFHRSETAISLERTRLGSVTNYKNKGYMIVPADLFIRENQQVETPITDATKIAVECKSKDEYDSLIEISGLEKRVSNLYHWNKSLFVSLVNGDWNGHRPSIETVGYKIISFEEYMIDKYPTRLDVVMLPASERTSLSSWVGPTFFGLPEGMLAYIEVDMFILQDDWVYQHLYFTSNETLKVNDLALWYHNEEIYIVTYTGGCYNRDEVRKIHATSNTNLHYACSSIPEVFIQYYAAREGTITEVHMESTPETPIDTYESYGKAVQEAFNKWCDEFQLSYVSDGKYTLMGLPIELSINDVINIYKITNETN